MYEYEYTGGYPGTMSFAVDDKTYVVSNCDPRLSRKVMLPRKVDIAGLSLVGEAKQSGSELNLDLNNDGRIDEKDASIAGKVLRKTRQRNKKTEGDE